MVQSCVYRALRPSLEFLFDTGGDIESSGRQASVAMQVDDAGTSSSLAFVDTGGDIESSSDCTILDGHAHKRARTASDFLVLSLGQWFVHSL